MSWRPIETLTNPSEGQCVLGAEWQPNGLCAVGEMHWTSGGWYWAGNDPTDSWGGQIYPSDWQPLPEPPATR